MQTSILENLDALSPECRQALKTQIKRVQMEAKHLRIQMDELRRAQHAKKNEQKYLLEAKRAEKEERKHLREAAHAKEHNHKPWLGIGYSEEQERKSMPEQIAATSKEWQQNALKYSKQLPEQIAATSKEWQQNALKRGKQIKQLTTTGTVLTKDGTQLGMGLERGKNLPKQLSKQASRSKPILYKQGKQAGQHIVDWKDDLAFILLKQGQHLLHHLMDRRDEATHMLRKQSKKLGRKIADRTDDVAWQLYKQRHQLERNLSYQKEDTARKLRKQGRKLNLKLNEHRTLWSALGFVTGLLIAGGIAYWFTKRMFHRPEEDENRELQQQYPPNEGKIDVDDEMRYARQGRTATATKRGTRAEPTSMFVGVLNTKRYYPIERRPDVNAQDLVFFGSEEDARAEGFSAAR